MSENYILWLGGVFTPDVVANHLAVNPAANRWRNGFIDGIQANGVPIHVLSHRSEQCWPKGMLFPGRASEFQPEFEQHLVRFMNAPGIRFKYLAYSYTRCAKRLVAEFGKPTAVLNYNPYPWHLGACRYLKRALGVKWVNVTLDYDDPSQDRWASYSNETKDADGHVFLSRWAYDHCPSDRCFHLDAGVHWLDRPEAAVDASENQQKLVVYSGKINDVYGGAGLLADAFSRIKTPDVQLLVCGKGQNDQLNALALKDSRVELKGFVSDEELHALSRRASVFINPRPVGVSDSRMIFPSKLLSYMSYLKPIVSTWTPGLDPAYRKYFSIVEEDDPAAIAAMVDDLLSWDRSQCLDYANRVHDFLTTCKTWQTQTRGLLEWMREDVNVQF